MIDAETKRQLVAEFEKWLDEPTIEVALTRGVRRIEDPYNGSVRFEPMKGATMTICIHGGAREETVRVPVVTEEWEGRS